MFDGPLHLDRDDENMVADAGELKKGRWRDALSRDEIECLVAKRDLRGWASIACNWLIIFAAMALVAIWPNPLTLLAALFVIGARQLGLAVFMHDASHRALLGRREVNDWAGRWLCGYPVWADMDSYRPYHLQHHAKTWTKEDPDVGLATPFPITAASFRRKVLRDLSGRTGLKFAGFALQRDLGDEQGRIRFSQLLRHPRMRGTLLTNALLFALVSVAGYPLLYLLWVASWLTTYTLVTRIRAIAEHSMSPDPMDPLQNTRTTLARWWERLLIAPNHVNYHLEHHLLMTVPHYNLPRMHAMLRERGVLDGALVTAGYPGILGQAASG